MIDIHSHILPEIDDGATDWEASVQMCRIAVDDGVATMVATPHMLDGTYNVSRAVVLAKVTELQDRLTVENIALSVLPGADIHADAELSNSLRRGELVTINDNGKYLLVEFPAYTLPPYAAKFLFSIRTMGFIPIITHPERNYQIQRHPEILTDWVRMGVMMQITAGSILGEFGHAPKKCCERLMHAGLAHIIASDAHSPDWRRPGLSAARAVVSNILGEEEARSMCCDRPQRVIDGQEFELPDPRPIRKKEKKFLFF